MFTGLVENTGTVVSLEPYEGHADTGRIYRLVIEPREFIETQLGDSVAINGCCLTVTNNQDKLLAFDINHETFSITQLGGLKLGSVVNLERAMLPSTRFGGHIVSGHVDCSAQLQKLKKSEGGWDLQVSISRDFGRYIVKKGSICLDGVSLTVNTVVDKVDFTEFNLMLIPTTIEETNFKYLAEGYLFNVETDLMGKYIERLLESQKK